MYVYILESNGFYKIGIADDVYKRIRHLQTGNPHPIKLMGFIQVDSRRAAEAIEATVHSSLRQARVSGEWFKLESVDAILEIIAILSGKQPQADFFPIGIRHEVYEPEG